MPPNCHAPRCWNGFAPALLRNAEIVIKYAVRGVVAGFLLYRVIKLGKDDRFDDMRDSFFKFLAFWIFQVLL